MNKKIVAGIIVASLFGMTGCSKVPAGYAGVKVNLLGGDKGVDTEELGTGRYWIGMNEDLFLFPTFTQNYTWSKSDERDESISFQTVEGLTVNADVGISYSIRKDKVTDIFQKYRKGVDEITDTYLRNMVRDALVTQASTLKIDAVYGAGKAKLISAVEKETRNQVNDLGIVIEKIYWVGELRLPPNVVQSINAKIQATQMTAQRENEINQSKAEAQKKIEDARGDAESTRLRAIAEAEAIRIKSEALRSNPEVLQLEAISKWNGVLPTYMTDGAGTPFIKVK